MRSIPGRNLFALAAFLGLLACNKPYVHPPSRGAGASEPHRGGVLRMAIDAEPTPLDPHSLSEIMSGSFALMLFDTLVEYAPGTTDLRPGLAERWHVSEDRLTYTFHLRPGVRFSNGRLLDARDIKRSFERMLDPALVAFAFASFFSGIEGVTDFRDKKASSISGITVLDAATVAFHLDRPDGSFLSRLTIVNGAIVPVDVIESMGAERFGMAPVGTGEFVIEHWERGTRMVLRRNDVYWRPGRPYLDGVVVDFNIPGYLSAMRFRRGDLDALTLDDPRWFDARPGWRDLLVRTAQVQTQNLVMNTEMPPWDNVHLRRAVAYAIDRDALARVTHGGMVAGGGLFPPGMPGHDPHLPNAQRYDVDLARREMAAAGYENGLPGEQAVWVMQSGTFPQMAALIQADLARIGVRLQLRVSSVAAVLEAAGRRHAAALTLNGWAQDFPDPVDFAEPPFHSKGILEEGSFNQAFYSSHELDGLLDRASVEKDPAARLDLYRDAERRIVDAAPWAFLGFVTTIDAIQPYVRSLRPSVIVTFDVRDAWLDLPTRAWAAP